MRSEASPAALHPLVDDGKLVAAEAAGAGGAILLVVVVAAVAAGAGLLLAEEERPNGPAAAAADRPVPIADESAKPAGCCISPAGKGAWKGETLPTFGLVLVWVGVEPRSGVPSLDEASSKLSE